MGNVPANERAPQPDVQVPPNDPPAVNKPTRQNTKDDKKSQVECSGCLDTLDGDHGGIQCVQGHHLCLDTCAKEFVDLILSEPLSLIPVKCPTCKVEIKSEVIQRVMTEEQLDKYLYYHLQITAKTAKREGEVFCMCPFCKYFEYRMAKEEDILFTYCLEPKCKKISCFVCKLSLDVEDQKVTDFHVKCASLREQKEEFEQVLHRGVTVPCPNCGLAGMKDTSCSHMHCPSCDADWCYVCGKTRQELGIEGNFYSHFRNWQTDEADCPMYLHSINTINRAFPDDDAEALQKFHENRSKMLLKEFLNKVGEATFNELRDHFESVKNCGFTLQDINNAPTHVFRSCETAPNTCVIS